MGGSEATPLGKGLACRLFNDLEAVFFDDRIGQHFLGDALELRLGFIAVPSVEVEDEKLALAYVLYSGVTQAGERVMDGLSLRIEYGTFWHHPDVCFHEAIIALGAEYDPESATLR